MLTEYYNTILLRARALGYEAPTEEALEALQQQALLLKEDEKSLKPITRKTPEGVSLHQIGGVQSVKVYDLPLGEGRFARAYLHVDGLPEDDKLHHYVVKVFHYSGQLKKIPCEVQKEIDVLKKLGRYIRDGSRYSGYNATFNLWTKTKYYVVQQYIPEKTLIAALRELGNEQPLKLEQALLVMIRLTEALQSFHATGYRHGDIKGDNIRVKDFLSPDPKLALIDFNHSMLENEPDHLSGFITVGQYIQIPPECCYKTTIFYTTASDIYALGYVFLQLLERTAYFSGVTEECDSVAHQMRHPKSASRPTVPQLIRTLTILKDGLSRRVKQFQAQRQTLEDIFIPENVKQATIQALRAYNGSFNHSLCSWGAYLGVLSQQYDQKGQIFIRLTIELENCYIKVNFHEILKKGLIEYVRKFVADDLLHYSNLQDLGAGIKCFTDAIKACGDQINQESLTKELAHVLSPHWEHREDFIAKFKTQLQFTPKKGLTNGL